MFLKEIGPSKQVTFTHKKAQMTFTHKKPQMTFTHKKAKAQNVKQVTFIHKKPQNTKQASLQMFLKRW